MALSRVARPNSGSPRCQASIEACMELLTLSMGRLSIPAEACLFSLLSQCFTKMKGIFNLADPSGVLAEAPTLERILNSIFDTTSVPFVTEKSIRIVAGLDDHDKSCLFLQAVAGMALIFRRLGLAGGVVTAGMLSRELQLFAECEKRRAILDKIGDSHVFSTCYTKSSVVDFLMAAIDERESGRRHGDLPSDAAGADLLSDSMASVSDRPCKNMGLPWGFTIMALN